MKGLANTNRTYHEIIAEILQTVKSWKTDRPLFNVQSSQCRSHHISHSISLPWTLTREYLHLLKGQELLISSSDTAGIHYNITAKGEEYLRLFAEIKDLLRPISTEKELLINYE
jgi:predicted transcriptional regulator